MRKILITIGFICITFLGTLLAYQQIFWKPERTLQIDLRDAIPSEFDDWSVADLELAESEEMQDRVEDILQFTDAVFRTYTQGDTQISVYIAYWEPRTMPVRMVQAHTPDICWVRNGWEVDGSEYAVALECQGQALKPAEFRIMTKDPALQYVYYWHVIGDEIYVNRIVGTWDRWDPIKSLFRVGFNQQREQFFIRVACNRPFDQVWGTPVMDAIMSDLAELALVSEAENTQT